MEDIKRIYCTLPTSAEIKCHLSDSSSKKGDETECE